MSIYLRKAADEDMMLLFEWANEETVRQNAFNQQRIPIEEHIKWFSRMMSDPDQIQYILMDNDINVGQVRLILNTDGSAVIDYSVDKAYRGLGYGIRMLSLLKETVHKDHPAIKKLIGQVKSGNTASEKCFLKCGYKEVFKEYEISLLEK